MPVKHSLPVRLMAFVAPVLIAIGGCAGSGSGGGGSWLDPMQSRSPIYTAVSPSAAQSRAALSGAPICCDSLSQLRFEPLDTKRSDFQVVDGGSQAFNFNTGKSFVKAFAIPDDLERATLTLEAVAGATVFVPTVLVLDRDFRVSRAIDSQTFVYTPATFMEPQRLRGSLFLDRRQGAELAGERYLVVLTTDKDLKGSTQMLSEARLYARSRGLADPGLPDPTAEHAATGVFRLAVSDVETGARSSTQYVDQRQQAGRYVAGPGAAPGTRGRTAAAQPAPSAVPISAPISAPGPAPAPTPAPSKPKSTPGAAGQPMLSDTQGMYDRMIRESVASGDMDRAWRLVQEAERAGSTNARRTFLQSVERK